ncbi:TM2 domain-containing protein [Flavobacterium rhizosphaerae]|uniref:TM2 domain-containing protein n=1 Tax=Flavobacterium rhizosphaerae TaxID=3163298 RepID=A0ABW8YVZ7_9FLAO
MEQSKVENYLMVNSKYFKPAHLQYLRDRLLILDESKWFAVQSIELKAPDTTLLISIFAGGLGIDRFYIGDTGLGVGKLLTAGGCGIWAIVDWFLIQDAAREKNMEKMQMLLG